MGILSRFLSFTFYNFGKSVGISQKVAAVSGRVYVTDGDGVRINGVEYRLFGIDAPEFGEPYSRMAKTELVRIAGGKVATIEAKGVCPYGRTVAIITVGGVDLSAHLVKKGFALDWHHFSGGKYRNLEPKGIRRKLWRQAKKQHR
jgi:micrococcal nuclease